MTTYSKSFKESLVKKVLNTPGESMSAIAREAQVSTSALSVWCQRLRGSVLGEDSQVDSSEKLPSDWTLEERFEALLASSQLSGEALNQYCRSQGIYTHQLELWRKDFMKNSSNKLSTQVQQKSELKKLKAQNQDLKRELRRKEKALAEASALLLLKKKADLIWPGDEDE